MRINSCNLGMDSERISFSSKTRTSHFVSTFSQNFLDAGMYQESGEGLNTEQPEDEAIAKKTGNRLEDSRLTALKSGKVHDTLTEAESSREFRRQVLLAILEKIFGKDRMRDALGDRYSEGGYDLVQKPVNAIGMQMATTETYTYSESVSMSFKGNVTCADGTEISVDFGVSMSQTFSQSVTTMTDFKFVDPLVLNFGGSVAELKEQSFYFDLDCDGTEENLKRLGLGSGFLALDSNGDNLINDGSELFGTRSGDGFADLAKYDEDGNGWIDEADAIWKKLRIWAFDAEGNSELYTLEEKGIGAMYLGSMDGSFSLMDDDGNTNAYIRKTGMFLYENGMSGTLQHLDYVTD